jgi:hypothetical protein
MRTFKYTYMDAKGLKKEATVEADDKDDAYIILKTMRINPLAIVETQAEDIQLEILGQPDEKDKKRPRINYAGRGGGAGKKSGGLEFEIEHSLSLDELRRPPEPERKIDWNKLLTSPPKPLLFFLFCLGVSSIGWSSWASVQETAMLDWPITRARVTSSDMLIIGVFGKTYKPDIEYVYVVEGETYRSRNLFSHPKETTRGECKRLVETYAADKRMYIHYKEDARDVSFVEFSAVIESHLFSGLLGLGSFSLAIGLFVLKKLNDTGRTPGTKRAKKSAAPRKAPAAGEPIVIE